MMKLPFSAEIFEFFWQELGTAVGDQAVGYAVDRENLLEVSNYSFGRCFTQFDDFWKIREVVDEDKIFLSVVSEEIGTY